MADTKESLLVAVKKFKKKVNIINACLSKISAGFRTLGVLESNGCLYLRHVKSETMETVTQVREFEWSQVKESQDENSKNWTDDFLLVVKEEFSIELHPVTHIEPKDSEDELTGISMSCEVVITTDLLKSLLRDRGKECSIKEVSIICLTTKYCPTIHLATLLINNKFVIVLSLSKNQPVEMMSCFALDDSMPALPVVVPVLSLIQVKRCHSLIFCLFSSGISSILCVIHHVNGDFIGCVDIQLCHNTFKEFEEGDSVSLQQIEKTFFHLEVTADLSLLISTDDSNNIYTVNLDHYFYEHPHHLYTKHQQTKTKPGRLLSGFQYDAEDEDLLLRDTRTLDITYGDRVWKTELVDIQENVRKQCSSTEADFPGVGVCNYEKETPRSPNGRWFDSIKDTTLLNTALNNRLAPQHQHSQESKLTGFLLKRKKSESRSLSPSSESSLSINKVSMCSKLSWVEVQSTVIQAEPWMKTQVIQGLSPASDSLLVWLVPNASKKEVGTSTVYEFPFGLVCLYGYDGLEVADRQLFLEPSLMVKSCASLQPVCVLTQKLLSVPSFGVNQNQLVHKVIMYENAALAESLCHINHWDHCVIPLEALQVALKHRQLDTVAFFLKNQENVFTCSTKPPPPSASLSPQYFSTSPSIKVVPVAMDSSQTEAVVNALAKSVKKNALQQHNRHYTSQLLQMTLMYLHGLMEDGAQFLEKNTHARTPVVCSDKPHSSTSPAEDKKPIMVSQVEESLTFITGSIVELRQFLSNLPEDLQQITQETDETDQAFEVVHKEGDKLFEKWSHLECKEVIRDAVISGNIARAQAFFMSKRSSLEGGCDGSLASITAIGFNQMLSALISCDLDTAVRIIINLVGVLEGKGHLTAEEQEMMVFVHALERLYNQQSFDMARRGLPSHSDSWTDLGLTRNTFNLNSTHVLDTNVQTGSLLIGHSNKQEQSGGYAEVLLDWIQTWDSESRQRILIDRILWDKDSSKNSFTISAQALWNYLSARGDWQMMRSWVRATALDVDKSCDDPTLSVGDGLAVGGGDMVLPPISRDVYSQFPACLPVIKDIVVDELTRYGMFTTEQLSNFNLLLRHLCRTQTLFSKPHPVQGTEMTCVEESSEAQGGSERIDTCSSETLGTSQKQITSLADFHGRFIEYSIELQLVNLLYYYLDFYSLGESMQTVRDLGLDINQPAWVDMMVRYRLAGGHPEDRESIFHASLSNARIMFKSSTPSVSDMLKAGCPVMALATLVYGPQPISQAIIPTGCLPDNSAWQVEESSLRKSMSAYPKLLTALFPVVTSVHGMEPQDITVYQLLQGNSPFEISRMFGWQQTNDLAVKADMVCEMPHFSLAPLASQHSHTEQLTFSYYLRHGRPSFAFTAFVGGQLSDRGIPRARTLGAARKAYRVAVQSFTDSQVSSACVVFTEMLGMDSANLRVDLQAANRVLAHGGCEGMTGSNGQEGTSVMDRIVSELVDSAGRGTRQPTSLLSALEEATRNLISKECLDTTSFEASQHWNLVILFCRVHKMDFSMAYLVDCAKMNKWLPLVCFAQVWQFPKHQVLEVVNQHLSNRHFKEHLQLAFENVQVIRVETSNDEAARKRRRRRQTSRKSDQPIGVIPTRDVRAQFYARMGLKAAGGPEGPAGHQSSSAEDDDIRAKSKPKHSSDKDSSSATSPTDGMASVEERPRASSKTSVDGHERPVDVATVPEYLFDVLFSCQSANVPWRALLAHAIALHRSIFAVLAACYEESKPVDCLCAWLYSTLNPKILEPVTETLPGVQWRRWGLQDLSAVITVIVSYRAEYAVTLSKAFYIFDPNSPIVHFFQFHESFVVHCDFDNCSKELDLFKKAYHKLTMKSTGGTQPSLGTTSHVIWLENVTSLVTQQMLRQCDTSYEQGHLLALLAKTMFGRNFTCNVPNYYMFHHIYKITRDTEIAVNFAALLDEKSASAEQERPRVLNALLDCKHFAQAREYANLMEMPLDDITLNEVRHERESIENSVLWEISQGRLAFWHKADMCFKNNRCDPEVAGSFFESQADDPELSFTEKSRLLSMALGWYSKTHDTREGEETRSVEERNDLETRIWVCCIRAEMENTNEAKFVRSISHLEFLPNTSEWALELPTMHRGDGIRESSTEMTSELIQPENIEIEVSMQGVLKTDEEMSALERVIGQLLDRDHVTQCRRLSAQFGHGCQDLDIVVACIHLAQGTRFSDTLDDSVRKLLSQKPHRRISVSGSGSSFRRSGSFVIGTSLSESVGHGAAEDSILIDWVQVEDTITAMEALTYYCQQGKRCCARIITCYKIAQTLGLEYEAVVADKPFNVLHSLLVSGFDTRYKLADSYIKAFELSPEEVVGFLTDTILHSLKVYTGEELSGGEDELIFNAAPSCDDLIQVIRLCSDHALLGNRLLETNVNLANERAAGSATNRTLNLEVELLVRAHECHTMACNMEGIASVLKRGKRLTAALAGAKEYRLMVRLLTGVGRFREMSYILDTLLGHHHFELLCQTGIDKENKLKVALLEYLKRCHPDDADKYSMVAVHFNMYREIAETWQKSATTQLKELQNQQIAAKPELQSQLNTIMRSFSYAADYYSKEGCLLHSQTCLKHARLVQLQIHLLPSGVRVINLDDKKLRKFLAHHTHFFETLLVVDAYNKRGSTLWVDAVYHHVVIGGDFKYWQDLKSVMAPSSVLFADVANKYKNDSPRSSQAMLNMKKLLNHLLELRVRYRIAMDLGFRDVSSAVLEGDGGAYLRDVMAP